MMVLAELTTYLAAQGIGVAGTTIYYGVVPETPDALVALFEYGGKMNEPAMGTGNTALEFPDIQMVCRGIPNDYDGPRQKAQDVVAAFTKVINQNLSGIGYKAIEAKQAPFLLHRDANFRVYFACNFRVTKGFSAS